MGAPFFARGVSIHDGTRAFVRVANETSDILTDEVMPRVRRSSSMFRLERLGRRDEVGRCANPLNLKPRRRGDARDGRANRAREGQRVRAGRQQGIPAVRAQDNGVGSDDRVHDAILNRHDVTAPGGVRKARLHTNDAT